MLSKLRLQGRLIACAVVVAVLAIVATITPSLVVMDDIISRAEQRELQSYYQNITSAVADEAAKATALSALVANIPDAQAAMASGDRDRLAKLFVPAFQALRKDYGAVQMQFHTPPATSFMRVHRPDRFGDDLSSFRHTVVATNSGQKPTQGLEFGVEGLGVRGMVPVNHDGRHIGSFEFGMSFGQFFFDSFKKQRGVDVALFVQDKEGMKRFAGTFTDEALTQVADLATALAGETVVRRVTTENGPRTVLVGAVRDYSGKPFGSVVIAMDSSEYVSAIDLTQKIAVGVGFGALVIGILIAWLIGRNISRPIRLITQTMNRLSGGDISVAVAYQNRHDEVGEMARAVAVFKRNAEEKVALERGHEETIRRERELEAQQRATESAATAEIADVVAGAARGDFFKRLDESNKEGFLKSLAEGMNRLIATIDHVLAELGVAMSGLAQGNLSVEVTGSYDGQIKQLQANVNASLSKLREITGRIGEAALNVNTASTEIAAGTQDLARRTESQAATLAETASAMQRVTKTVKENADNAIAANEKARMAHDAAEEGASIVSRAVGAMNEIEESAKKIADIVNLIDEIAFQTNLLALNAGVEAARAGEAGKGFAVVAQEVRALAQRSATASKDIKNLIVSSNGHVHSGVELVNSTGEALNRILSSVKQVSDIVGDISTASARQAKAMEDINVAVVQMDEMTQHNRTLVEETSAATQNLASQSTEMTDLVNFFHVQENAPIGANVEASRRRRERSRPTALPAPV